MRTFINEKESTVNWTKSLEENRLSEKIDTYDNIASTVKLSPDVLKIKKDNCQPVYPYIENFASLDTKYLLSSWKDIISKLVDSLNNNLDSEPENLIDSQYIFNYVFFISDFKDYLETKINYEKKEQESVINRYIIGEPFVSSDLVQIPVRLFINEKTMDIAVYIKNNGNGKISQIEILNQEN